MNKFLTSVSSIGAVVLLVTAGCVAERSPEEISYNATVSRLDQGGDYLFYLHLDGIAEEVDDAVDTVAEAVEPESESTVEMIHYGLDLLGIDQLRGLGLSSRRIAAEEPFYRIRCFEYTGENPEGVLFDLAGRENRPFTMHRWIPKGTRLAAGGFLNLGAAYRALAAGLKAAPFEEMKEVPEILDEGAKATFGQSAETLLDSVSGEYFLLAATVGENDAEQNCALMLVIPDQGGVLGSRLLKEYAPMLTRVEGRENTFALPVVFPLPGLVPQVTFGSDRITLVSNPAILAAVEKAAAGNGAAADPELAAYFADMPEAGLNYLYVNIDKELIDSVLALGECAGNNPGLQPSLEMLGAILGALDEPVCYMVETCEKDGYASVARANVSMSDFQLKFPIRFYGAMIATMFRQVTALDGVGDSDDSLCTTNLQQLLLVSLFYASDHDERFPAASGAAGLKELDEYLGEAPTILICPEDKRVAAKSFDAVTEENVSYVYFGNIKTDEIENPSRFPVIFDKPGVHADGELHVGFADGHVQTYQLGEYVSPEQVILMLNEEVAYPKPVFDDLMNRAKAAVAK